MFKRCSSAGRLAVYLGIVFALTYGYGFLAFPAILRGIAMAPGNALAALPSLLMAVAMLFPTLAMLLTRLFTGEGFRRMNLAPHFKGHIRFYLLAWFGPILLIAAGAAVYYALFPAQFDPGLEALVQAGAAQGIAIAPSWGMIAVQTVQAVLIAPAVNFVFCLGEEWGWRGYMMPKLRQRFGFAPACLIGGVIWGVWHAPFTAIGHNYGTGYPGFPFTGILTMCVFCTALGTLLTWLSEKTGSCLPAALAHGAVNGQAAITVYLCKPGAANPLLGPGISGLVGGLPLILLAAFCLWRLRGQKAAA